MQIPRRTEGGTRPSTVEAPPLRAVSGPPVLIRRGPRRCDLINLRGVLVVHDV